MILLIENTLSLAKDKKRKGKVHVTCTLIIRSNVIVKDRKMAIAYTECLSMRLLTQCWVFHLLNTLTTKLSTF